MGLSSLQEEARLSDKLGTSIHRRQQMSPLHFQALFFYDGLSFITGHAYTLLLAQHW